jgi:hypothetical protein
MHGGVQLTRAEISQVYKNVGINASGLRLAYLIMRADLDAVISVAQCGANSPPTLC